MQRILEELAAELGMPTAITIARKWGGHDLKVPVKIDEAHPISLSIGFEAAQKLVKAFGGEKLSLPIERHALRSYRDAEIVRAVTPVEEGGQGMSHAAAGAMFGLTRQSVTFILGRARDRGLVFAGAKESAAT